MQESLKLENKELFLREGFATHLIGARFIVKDLMNTVYHSLVAFMSTSVWTVRAAMLHRVRADLKPHLTGSRGKHVATLILLKDDPELVTPHKKMERLRRDEAGRGGAQDEGQQQGDVEDDLKMSLDRDLGFSWGKHVLGNAHVKDSMTCVYAILSAMEAAEPERGRESEGHVLEGSGSVHSQR